jgi:hypothetical protein
MYRKQSDMVKDWLTAYRNEEAIIGEQLERIRELKARIMSVGAQEITDMPRAPAKIRDTLAEYMIRMEELEEKMGFRLLKHEADRAAILRLLDRLQSNDERKIIKCRYLYGQEWNDILLEVYRKAEGFSEKQESYRRKMYRAHESALEDMAKHWSEKTD